MTVLFRNFSALMLALLFSGALVSAQDLQPKKTGLPGRTVWALATSGTSSVTTFAATDKGLWRSNDNGTSWTETSLKNIAVYAVKSRDIGKTSTLLVGTDRGVLRSTDGGNTWASPEVTTGTVSTSNIVALKKVFDIEVVGNAWFAATEKGVYRSNNDGRSWSLVNIDRTADNNEVRGISVDGNIVIVNLWKEGLWRSTNSGNSWTKLTIAGESALCRSVFVHQATNATVWLAGAVSGNLWRSTNSGNSWTKVATSSSVQRSAAANTFAGMDALTSLGKALIAGTATGLAVSVDNGITWKQLQTATPKPISLVSDGRNRFYVGMENASNSVMIAKGSTSELTSETIGVAAYVIPNVFSWTPSTIVLGTPRATVTIRGSDFDNTTQLLGQFLCTATSTSQFLTFDNITKVSDSVLTAVLPSALSIPPNEECVQGVILITLGIGGQTFPNPGIYGLNCINASPTISSVSPSSITRDLSINPYVIVNGTNFQEAGSPDITDAYCYPDGNIQRPYSGTARITSENSMRVYLSSELLAEGAYPEFCVNGEIKKKQ